MLAQVMSGAVLGVEAYTVRVEVDLARLQFYGLALDDVLRPSALVAELLGRQPPALLPKAGGFPPSAP